MSESTSQIDALLANLPDACKDVRLNLQTILRGTSLDAATTLSAAISGAYFCGDRRLAEALAADGASTITADDLADAQAAAALMGMTTVYYRTRHLLNKDSYKQMRPSMRMNRMLSPASRIKYEACALTCAALGGCEDCLRSHEEQLLKHGLTEDNCHDLIRIAAIINSVHVGLTIG
jgi:lipoyl-dependent peroxiredoxin subunit D